MITTPEEWAMLTDAQRYDLLTGTQIDRNNLRQHVAELNGRAAAERQQSHVTGIRGQESGATHPKAA